MSLLLFQLRDEIARFSHLPGSMDTNVEKIAPSDWGQLLFSVDSPELEEKKKDIQRLEKEVEDLEKQVEDEEYNTKEAEEKLEKALRVIDDLKDPASGVTVAEMLTRMEEAEKDMEASRERVRLWAAQDAEREKQLKALRARKGVGPKVMSNLNNIVKLVGMAAKGEKIPKEAAAELLERLTAKD